MRYAIILSPEAMDDLGELKANIRAVVRDAIEEHLRHEPEKTSKSRIKRLRGLSRPQYRLRVGDVRIFYDVTEKTVEVLVELRAATSLARAWQARQRTAEARALLGEICRWFGSDDVDVDLAEAQSLLERLATSAGAGSEKSRAG